MSEPQQGKAELSRLVEANLPYCLRLALRLTGDPDVAEEVVQEVMVRVIRSWSRFRGEASVRTWLYRIVVNVIQDRRRQQVRLLAAQALAVVDDPEVSEALVSRLRTARHRRDVLAALTLHADPVANRFLAVAQRDSPLAAELAATNLFVDARGTRFLS